MEKYEVEKQIKGSLKLYSEAEITTIYQELESGVEGLSSISAEKKIKKYGLNEISNQKPKVWYVQLFLAFLNPFNLILGTLAVVSVFTDIVFVKAEEKSWVSIFFILSMILISSLIKFIQEYNSSKTAQRLKGLIVTKVTVLRDGDWKEIDLKKIVPGDVIKLAAGDIVPGDLRIIKSKDLFISQSVLTGESDPVEKSEKLIKGSNIISEISNLALMGTNILSGSATGIVLHTGGMAFLSTISENLSGLKVETSFEKGIDDISKLLIKFMFVMVPIVFFINGYLKHEWFESLLFSLSVAIGLTPEMLPMIVTGNLTKGAIELSKKKTIVKKLDSIHNFGAMNILCTDKTGTLTLDKVSVVKYLNLHGEQDDNVLYFGYLNSFFQTGLKNLMDRAILDFEDQHAHIKNEYKKIDELPFDFDRRRMSVILEDNSKQRIMITKGAIEEMLSISKFAEVDGEIIPLEEEIGNRIKDLVNELNNDGMRVIGISKKLLSKERELNFAVKDEVDVTFIGILGFLDPAKEGVGEILKSLNGYGVNIKILTGDNELVTKKVCRDIGIDTSNTIDGELIDKLEDIELKKLLGETTIFCKLSPSNKSRIIKLLQEMGNTVGFMGDGINDSPALRQADVGISVDTGVDIAKESAEIILLEKDLTVLLEGVIGGRKVFTNMTKYLKMTASSNFGNVFSVVIASAFLPFLPMLPIQILFQNLLYDISQISIPWDNVDEDEILKPKNWSAENIGTFMIYIGPVSSIFDILTFLLMFYVFKANSIETQALFHTGWFIESILSQTLIIHLIRTRKIPFIQSNANIKVILLTSAIMIFAICVPYTKLNISLEFVPLVPLYFVWIIFMLFGYFFLILIMKRYYIKKFKNWL
ncbi:MAG: magnesium-translocating P-type ATPase [Cetobacterium sp.]|uniref:magnesium-translocating P-type ATPase n=2 Tax=Cetobacterium sp. TaxID=2071632 RepID=UPI002FC9633C